MGAYVLLTCSSSRRARRSRRIADRRPQRRGSAANAARRPGCALAGARGGLAAQALRELARRSRSVAAVRSSRSRCTRSAARASTATSSSRTAGRRRHVARYRRRRRSSGSSRSRTGRASSSPSARSSVLSIFLRQRGSPESKPVAAPDETDREVEPVAHGMTPAAWVALRTFVQKDPTLRIACPRAAACLRQQAGFR